jgi:hypothetical protein
MRDYAFLAAVSPQNRQLSGYTAWMSSYNMRVLPRFCSYAAILDPSVVAATSIILKRGGQDDRCLQQLETLFEPFLKLFSKN